MSGSPRQQGRPLRFLLIVLLCWSGTRLAQSLSLDGGPSTGNDTAPAAIALVQPPPAQPFPDGRPEIDPAAREFGLSPVEEHLHPARGKSARRQRAGAETPGGVPALPPPSPSFPQVFGYAAGNMPGFMERASAADGPGALASFPPGAGFGDARKARFRDHWQLSAWMLLRRGMDGNATAGTGQLGASQIGMRIDRELASGGPMDGRLTAYARLSRALIDPASPEGAIGVAMQPMRRLPLTIGLERRIALGDGGRNAMAVVGATGIGPMALPGRMELEGYGQAGMVGVNSRDAFADGRLSLLRPVGHGRIAMGLGLSGGAQPQVARLDIGPEVRARLPVAGGMIRLDAGWRARVAGKARPGSGPAITLAGSF
ncbi:hypothetical protein PX699_15100 [Sphingobium sp. H39-3-25]|uniref:hypothetical protein n=1 Tax=Sphingobium arseniciresistens TaxID=3030834 RepID=UPI0023B8AEBC|nr:hypothetical protein [Sphingobium arseniciresistens]